MDSEKRKWAAGFSFLAMLILVLDTKTALVAAREGIGLCIATVIPSLLPFFVVSMLLTSLLSGFSIPLLAKLFGIPKGSEGVLLIGLLGGYPAGAQAVFQSWKGGCIEKEDAEKMLGFCCNAGPSFLFGMGSQLFESALVPWLLWLIHILSAYLCALSLPKRSHTACRKQSVRQMNLPAAMKQSVKTMAEICGWVVLFRIVIGFCQRWFLWLLPEAVQVVFSGLLELSNGCISLTGIESERLRFLFCAVFLAFGGICVGMQTVSVTDGLGTGLYFPGKCMQSGFSLLLAYLFQYLLFPNDAGLHFIPWAAAGTLFVIVNFVVLRKKKSSIPQRLPV